MIARAIVTAPTCPKTICIAGVIGQSFAPVATEKTISPSIRQCEGTRARANPSWAVIARRWASTLVRERSVAMTAIVVFARLSVWEKKVFVIGRASGSGGGDYRHMLAGNGIAALLKCHDIAYTAGGAKPKG